VAKRNTLICTVGTSLFEGNLSRLSATTANAPSNWQAIQRAYAKQNWKDLAGVANIHELWVSEFRRAG